MNTEYIHSEFLLIYILNCCYDLVIVVPLNYNADCATFRWSAYPLLNPTIGIFTCGIDVRHFIKPLAQSTRTNEVILCPASNLEDKMSL